MNKNKIEIAISFLFRISLKTQKLTRKIVIPMGKGSKRTHS